MSQVLPTDINDYEDANGRGSSGFAGNIKPSQDAGFRMTLRRPPT